MGQKVSPKGLRVGVIKGWDAQWFADKKTFSNYLVEDYNIRKEISKGVATINESNKVEYIDAGISDIKIKRKISSDNAYSITIDIFSSKRGVILGADSKGADKLRDRVAKIVKTKEITINIIDVKRPALDAQLVAEEIASQLEKRIQFRRAMKQSISKSMKAGALGIKTMVSGRLDGAEIARSESYHEGSIPLQTLRADIDYAQAEADTTFGKIGVKVWLYKGDVLGKPAVATEGGNV